MKLALAFVIRAGFRSGGRNRRGGGTGARDHSRAMFDMSKNITYRGVAEEYHWQNPHSRIVVRVGAGAADRSAVGTWTVEASAISIMKYCGWTPRTYKHVDSITVVAHPSMDGSHLVLLFYAIKADGSRLCRSAHQYDGEKE